MLLLPFCLLVLTLTDFHNDQMIFSVHKWNPELATQHSNHSDKKIPMSFRV